MSRKKPFALVFPGQGSQSVGMLRALAATHSLVEQTFKEASEVLSFDLWTLVQNGPEEDLNRTAVTQPALLAADIACYRVWRAQGGPAPDYAAGHSLGEYAALVAAGSLGFAEAVSLVAERGRAMQEAVPEGMGAMAAILGLSDPDVRAVCQECAEGEVLTAANYNAPGQVVIAGTRAAIERAVPAAKKRGAKRAIPLAVSVPSHCELMRPAAARLAPFLASIPIRQPLFPVLHNWNVAPADQPDTIRQALMNQLFSPVRWVETVTRLGALGAQYVIECGPGKILTGLNKRTTDSACLALGEPTELTSTLAEIQSPPTHEDRV